ncbi:peptidoglycan DD-metalloendopeptidase family protein [Leptodesmis sp.]|uniref:peptidoglycan DD-metalloendopeptidase family protein n=1 Tax=Leptodesmis sp. TaxID=3100501 RepID=UPI0040535757
MRRTFPQKVKPLPSCADEQEATTAQTKQALPDNNRRVRTSAAMIGLAISMGAYNLSVPSQSDSATAAEPAVGESTVPPADSLETAALFPEAIASQASSSESQPLSIKHTVQEGQTLWEVARFYGADAAAIASANNLSLDAVLRVGQVLIIPTDSRIAQALVTPDTAAILPGYYGPVAGRLSSTPIASASPATLPSPVDANLKVQQEEALKNLKQKRDSLRAGLATLPSEQSSSVKPLSQSGSNSKSVDETRVDLPGLLTSEQKADKAQLPTALPASDQKVAFGSVRNPQSTVRSNPSTFPENGVEDLVNYRVNRGDTLATIARAHGITLQELVQANRITNPNYILPDQVLVIPQSQSARESTQKFKGLIASLPDSPKSLDVSGSSPQSLITPAVSQETKVAAASSFAPQTTLPATNFDSKLLQSNNIANLKSEIEKLREKYSSQAQASRLQTQNVSAKATPATIALGGTLERVNPEFNPERYSSLKSRIREMRERIRTGQAPQAKDVSQPIAASESKPQLVAAASVGSESYDPLVQSRLGKTVSPELPPLGPGNEYLPGAPGRFEGYIWPTRGVLTSGFGWRWGRMHKGIDIAGPVGTPIMAAADGVVVTAGWNSGGYGYLVEIQHPDGSLTLYAHNSRILVQVGQQVSQGQQIAEMGSTGYSTGPHLHFEVHPNGRGAVNPMAFLPRDRG